MGLKPSPSAQPRARKRQMLPPGGYVYHCLIPEEKWKSRGLKLLGFLSLPSGVFLSDRAFYTIWESLLHSLQGYFVEVRADLNKHSLSRKF